MLDCNGANTTASAAVLNCHKHLHCKVNVFWCSQEQERSDNALPTRIPFGGEVGCHSRSQEKLEVMKKRLPDLHLCHRDSTSIWKEWLTSADAVIACGAAGIPLLSTAELASLKKCRVLIDLNAVPPLGLSNVQSQIRDKKGTASSVMVP